jgi:hypothetical protein
MKPIKLTPRQWRIIRERMIEEYRDTPSVIMMRSKMREVLGFTPREHTEYTDHPEFLLETRGERPYSVERNIMLDFYSEPMRTMFLLKYSHLINDNESSLRQR